MMTTDDAVVVLVVARDKRWQVVILFFIAIKGIVRPGLAFVELKIDVETVESETRVTIKGME